MRTTRLSWLALGAVAALPALAAADPRVDAISRHADADVAALRAELPGDAAVRCTLGAVYLARGDLPRAGLYLEPCSHADLPPELGDAVARARRALAPKLRDSELSSIDVITDPEGAWAEVDALPGERFLTPQTVWVPAGHHVVTATSPAGVTATNSVDTQPHAQGPLLITLAAPPPVKIRDGAVDMSEDTAGDAQAGPPPDQKHPPLTPQKFVDGGTVGGPAIADPLADGFPRRARGGGVQLGVRFGGGVFDHSGADARLGVAVAGAAAYPLGGALALAARLDWSRRGGTSDGMHGIDAVGATAGVQLRLARIAPLDLIAGAGPRVAVQLGDAMGASRATLAGAAWLEVPLRGTPIVAGVRVEQGITAFAPGAREQAALLELGVALY